MSRWTDKQLRPYARDLVKALKECVSQIEVLASEMDVPDSARVVIAAIGKKKKD